jgi:hypothetical protein
MKYKRIVTLLLFVCAGMWAFAVQATEQVVSKDVTIGQGQIAEDDLILAGNTVTVQGEARDDLIAAGSEITIAGAVHGYILAAGRNVTVNGSVGNDLFAAGANLKPWLRYLIAFVVFCHGFVYLRIGPGIVATAKEWRGASWLLGDSVTDARLKAWVTTLHTIAGIVTLACAVAIGFAPSMPGWWRPLAIGSAAFGLAAFAVFWDGQTRMLFEEGVIGAILSLILLGVAIAFPSVFD